MSHIRDIKTQNLVRSKAALIENLNAAQAQLKIIEAFIKQQREFAEDGMMIDWATAGDAQRLNKALSEIAEWTK